MTWRSWSAAAAGCFKQRDGGRFLDRTATGPSPTGKPGNGRGWSNPSHFRGAKGLRRLDLAGSPAGRKTVPFLLVTCHWTGMSSSAPPPATAGRAQPAPPRIRPGTQAGVVDATRRPPLSGAYGASTQWKPGCPAQVCPAAGTGLYPTKAESEDFPETSSQAKPRPPAKPDRARLQPRLPRTSAPPGGAVRPARSANPVDRGKPG